MKNVKQLLIVIAVLGTVSLTSAQPYINRELVNSYGSPDTIEWQATTKDFMNLITVGNTLVTNQHANILITKIDEIGMLVWQHDWDGTQSGSD